jgi:tRNA delta(2)-isopentenylpyrophosphate transferase
MKTENVQSKLPLVAIMGPTASGKTSLAIELAKKYSGEIICADSRTIYKGMDIGTAKPTAEEQKLVPHHMLDLIEPGERYTIFQFKSEVLRIIDEIRARGNIPFLVGGSGLYLYTILFDYDFDNKMRRKDLIDNCIAVGIDVDKNTLRERIKGRFQVMLDAGFVDEVRKLVKKYGSDTLQLKRNSYGETQRYIDNEIDENELKKRAEIVDWQLAKKQNTWFTQKKDKIAWLPLKDTEKYISDLLSE